MTAIQWFPGHMHLTRQAIRDRLKAGIDVVIELLDARCPAASRNPLIDQLTQHRPRLKVLTKQDLADPARTLEWLAHYNALPKTQALAMDTTLIKPAAVLLRAVRELAPNRTGMVKPLRVLICGIPNVGKSTLVNALLGGKKAAKTGDEPGITKTEQKILLAKDAYLYDTPGMLWPKIQVPESGELLAICGSIGRNAFEEELVALVLIERLLADYPLALPARYGDALPLADGAEALLEAIGRKRGAVASGGRVNLQKSAELVIHDFRRGLLGRITLETPELHAQWQAAALAAMQPDDDEEEELGDDELEPQAPSRAPVRRPRPRSRD